MDGKISITVISDEELRQIKFTQESILEEIRAIKGSMIAGNHKISNHITAMEFMSEVRICRSKFDELVAGNKIKTIKKGRKIYVPVTEVARYFLIA